MNVDIGEKGYNTVRSFRETHNNLLIIDTVAQKKTCYIYASSNGVWDPNTEESFQSRIIDNDEYEWKRMGTGGGRRIFIRDVLKEWYVNGINAKTNSIDAIIDLLKEETAEYEDEDIVCVGSSAGGYLAIILGIALNASHVICNSGQINLFEAAKQESSYPELNNALSDPAKFKWYDLTPIIQNSTVPIFYLYAANCKEDVEQFRRIENSKNINAFAFDGKHHGNTMYPFNWPYCLQMSLEELFELQRGFHERVISKNAFARKTMPYGKLLTMRFSYYSVKVRNKARKLIRSIL